MLKISISSELADAHRRFMVGCSERGHRGEVLENASSDVEPRAMPVPAPAESEAFCDRCGEEPGRR